MNKSLVKILLSVICSAFSVAAFSSIDHTPRDGDRLHPGINGSRQMIVSLNDSTKTVLLYPDAVSFDDSFNASAYIDSDTISFIQYANKYRFLLRNDTLSYIGYENRSTYFQLDSPVRMMVFPPTDSDVVREVWTGHVEHNGSMLLKYVRGESMTKVSDGWTLTDGTDTLRNIVRLTWTLDMSYVNPDSIANLDPDSITSEKISDMNVDVKALKSGRQLTERTLWFSPDARYPVLTDSRVSTIELCNDGSLLDTIPLSTLAMYYPPSFQYSDTGEEPVGKKNGNRGASDNYDDERINPSFNVGEPEIVENTLEVSLSSSGDYIDADIMLYSESGMRLSGPTPVTLGPVPGIYSVPVPDGWKGVLILSVENGIKQITRKVIL